ncbi:hypothetical protein QNI16_29345 [Cytophagaceae bacterium YF14B1]|uniref:Uncharacterized protein n=1 Tax=Xanthocytophaga flava TaxID=3048013 RepID=A0AAE3QW98_9BACT|nr:hypothetical protein [Xanthocytophaga flavus]MDJ1484640.1 hypothetical protein [Xanthocytophaga flavus]
MKNLFLILLTLPNLLLLYPSSNKFFAKDSSIMDTVLTRWKDASLLSFNPIRTKDVYELKVMDGAKNVVQDLSAPDGIRMKILTLLVDSAIINLSKDEFYLVEEFASGEEAEYVYYLICPDKNSSLYIYKAKKWNSRNSEKLSQKQIINAFRRFKIHLSCRDKDWSFVSYESISHFKQGTIQSKFSPVVCKSSYGNLFR